LFVFQRVDEEEEEEEVEEEEVEEEQEVCVWCCLWGRQAV
jgi:hypothetical protein